MKIVSTILTSQNGGAEQVFIDQLLALRNLGHEVLAIVKIDAPYAQKLEKLGIEVRKIKNNLGYRDFLAVSLPQQLGGSTGSGLPQQDDI